MNRAATKQVSTGASSLDLEYLSDIPPLQEVDYEALAKRCGDKAYKRATDANLPPEVAEQFREVFGQPIDTDLRLP